MDINNVQKKLNNWLLSYYEAQGYDEDEIKSSGLYSIQIDEFPDYIDVIISAELSVDDFFTIDQDLNEIVSFWDKSAYFDVTKPGTYSARIYMTAVDSMPEYELSSKDLQKFGEVLTSKLNDELNEDFWVEDIYLDKNSGKLYVDISGETLTSQTDIDVDLADVESYQDFLTLYLDEMSEALNSAMYEL